MLNSRYYCEVEKSEENEKILLNLEQYVENDPNHIVYVISAPLGGKYTYDYQNSVIVILSPNHKIIFLNLGEDENSFEDYYDEFLSDIYSISDRMQYKEIVGRPKQWKNDTTIKYNISEIVDIADTINANNLSPEWKRKGNVILTLLIGCINDIKKIGINEPQNLLDKVKQNIILFDGDQTRFIYKEFPKKTVSVQGLSGTGKTELLLHKLKEVYVNDEDAKIFLTCHNKALANSLRKRVPSFFNFLKVDKQIDWNNHMWIGNAWGLRGDANSGLYSYLCDYYNLPFYSWSYNVTYEFIFEKLLKGLEEIPEEEFKPAFDYIFIDERQDFPNVFIKVCEKVTKSKVYAAGDVFQNIFENVEGIYNVEVVLNRCYRTDPRTLMFAHATGMGLFEGKKLDWLSDDDWIKLGYKIINNENEVHLFREPINRFQELQDNNIQSVVIRNSTKIDEIMNAIAEIREQFPTVQPSDIAIIILDEGKDMYKYIENLSLNINAKHKWKVNRAFETKEQYEGSVYMTNSNNVKGLEFPFVICIASKIHDDYKQRNILYTMLTRSFLQTYLMVTNPEKLDVLQLGLSNINNNGYIKTTRPSVEEERAIKENILKFQQEQSSVSFSEFLDSIFEELEIFDEQKREKLATALANVTFNRFDKELVRDFIESNKRFY